MEEEIWKDIPGYDGIYQVSNLGRVKSIPRVVQFGNRERITQEKFLKPCNNGSGYYYVSLGAGVENRRYIHRLVAEAFIPNPDNLPEVNHIDENPVNNSVYNLEWCDRAYNLNYGTRIEKLRKPVDQLDDYGNVIKIWESITDAENYYQVTHIWECCAGKRGKCAGFRWRYHKNLEEFLKIMEELFDDDE